MQSSLQLWLDYIERHIGFVLPKAQHRWLANAINATAAEQGLSLEQLYDRLPKQPNLHQLLIDRVLIAESRFFRDESAITWIAEHYNTHKSHDGYYTDTQQTPFVVLSVGCSTGQEVWSLALALEYKKQACMHLGQPLIDYRIIGLDASMSSLGYAQTAQYSKREWAYIPANYRYGTYWVDDTHFGIQKQLKQRADFLWCNIFDAQATNTLKRQLSYAPTVILCQNMLIYFHRHDQCAILQRLADLLAEKGSLVLGAGEALFWQPPAMQRTRHATVNLWQKC